MGAEDPTPTPPAAPDPVGLEGAPKDEKVLPIQDGDAQTLPSPNDADGKALAIQDGGVAGMDRDAKLCSTVIIVVNPKSGGNAASAFMSLPDGGLVIDEPDGLKATVHSYSIVDPEKPAFKHLARLAAEAASNERVVCIVAGGDGTVMWTIEEIFKAEIPVEKVCIGTVPYGTGNDFSNVTGWGSSSGPGHSVLNKKDNFRSLHKYLRSWFRAEQKPFDIWEVSVQTAHSDTAAFQFIEDGKKVCHESHIQRHGIQKLPGGGLEMSKFVCNYLSVGLDARVGIGFDKQRQKSRFLNKAVYAWEGVKKLLFKKKGFVAQVVDNMGKLPEDALQHAVEGHDVAAVPEAETVFLSPSAEGGVATGDDAKRLVGNPVSLIFLNIPSIAGGLDIWNWSKSKMGVTGPRDLLHAEQDFGDGKIECISYRTGIGFYAEQVRAPKTLSGRGNRVYSGGGPLRLKFRDPKTEEYKKGVAHSKGRTYMQVDGEFFIVQEPESIILKHHKQICVLTNMEKESCCFG